MSIPTMVTLGILALAILTAVSLYNRLVALKNRFENAFAQIDVQLKRRLDLIPNLVETAKGYMKHETETLEAVTNARNQTMTALQAALGSPGDPAVMQQLAAAQAELGGMLSKLLAVAEAYPDLKADQSMNRLMEELTSTENRVAFARQAFNDAVTAYNTAREQFPANVFAAIFGFADASLLDIPMTSEEREPPKVSF